MIIILMGVSGSGKTTIGRRLAEELGWSFFEGDDYHPAENVAKMARGEALTDADRAPWLAALARLIQEALDDEVSAVLSCSALKQKYRAQLMVDPQRVQFVYLAGSFAAILQRLKHRAGHFMKADLLQSQFDVLEAPENGITIDINQSPAAIVAAILQALNRDSSSMTTQILLDGLMFPEGPRWHDDKFWFTDQHAQRIVSVDLNGQADTIAELDDLPGGLGWLPDGRLLVVSMTKRKILQLSDDGLSDYADLSQLASFHCNDMLVDRQGRAYVGNFGFDLHGGASQSPAELIVVEPDGQVKKVAENLIFPNGMALSDDGKNLFVAETFASRLTAFTVQPDGSLFERRVWANLGDAYPDGICLDKEDTIWVAAPNKGEILRVKAGGEILQRIKPKGAPYACMLGGTDGGTLFIASSETDDPAEAKKQKSGRIEFLKIEQAAT